MMELQEPMVSIWCLVYNHEPYLRQCLDGFVMQNTNFRFEAVVHDDASTDGSAAIIREYAEKYPEIIKPIFETENQWSKKDGSIEQIMNAACTGKYIAICEGDDYWTDPQKLQKQVDFLEANIEYSMCCSDAIILTPNGIESWTRYETNRRVPPEDLIMGGGLYVQTASILYRNGLLKKYPSYCTSCHVGDYPLKIWGAINGGLYWFTDKMVAYRFMSAGSWSERTATAGCHLLISGWRSEIEMLKGINNYTSGKYRKAIEKRMSAYVFSQMIQFPDSWEFISDSFPDCIVLFDLRKKVIHFVMTHHLSWIYRLWHNMRRR